jgi:hypothetical protein
MKDLCLKTDSPVWNMVVEENKRQLKMWGIQDHEPFEWLGFATEEIGETSQAISEYQFRGITPDNVVKEAIQTATLMLKIAEMFQLLSVNSDSLR